MTGDLRYTPPLHHSARRRAQSISLSLSLLQTSFLPPVLLLLLRVMLQLLPDSRVSLGVRNFVPLALETIGMALWGVAAGAIHERYAEELSEGWWRRTLEVRAHGRVGG